MCNVVRQPTVIDVVGTFAEGTHQELLDRHSRYGQRVREFSNGQVEHLLVLSRSRIPIGNLVDERDGLCIRSLGPSSNPWALGRTAAKLMYDYGLPIVWIAGTPFKESIACSEAKRRAPGSFQVQVHGDFGHLGLLVGGAKDKLRWALGRKYLRAADSVRAVSASQLNNLDRNFGPLLSKAVVSPVPINQLFLKFADPAGTVAKNRTIGFFGRLHEERGLKDWAKTAREIHKLDPRISFVVIGDGQEKKSFKHQLSAEITQGTVSFLGHLEGDHLVQAVSEISLILNTCPTESFGRAILEALAVNVPVLTVPSPGAISIYSDLEPDHLHIADRSLMAASAIQILDSSKCFSTEKFREELFKYEERSIDRLVKSWLKGNE